MKDASFSWLIFFCGIILIVLASGTLCINQDIANKSQGYFVNRNIEQANEAARLGYVKYEVNDYAATFGLDWHSPQSGVRRIIRSGPEDFDDVGYISMLELIAIAKKGLTLAFVENLHNVVFIISLAVVSFIAARLCSSMLGGWLFMVSAWIFKENILSLVYGSPDSRTFVISFPCILIAIIFLMNWHKGSLSTMRGRWLVFVFGLVIGMMVSIRSSEGLAAFYAVLASIALLKGLKARERVTSAGIILFGIFLITVVSPVIFALHRDIKTGGFKGDLKPYLQITSWHPGWHSLVRGLGKYPNSLGMKYDDITCYNIVRAKYPKAMHPKFNIQGEGHYDALRAIYFEYISKHPFEYAKNIVKSHLELFYFIPYATSAGNSPWAYGFLPIKPGVYPNQVDKVPSATGLVSLRFRYLKINFIQWMVFTLALFGIAIAVRSTFFGEWGRLNRRPFLSIGFYIFLLTAQRAIIPQHGLALIVAFWMCSIISLLYILFTDNTARYLWYMRLRILANRYRFEVPVWIPSL